MNGNEWKGAKGLSWPLRRCATLLATWLSSTCSSGSGDDPDSCHVVMRVPWKANKLWDDLRLRYIRSQEI